MYAQEEIKPYSTEGGKGQQVEQMFDNIAHSYDRLNHVLSLGTDRGWRRKTIQALLPYSPKTVLVLRTRRLNHLQQDQLLLLLVLRWVLLNLPLNPYLTRVRDKLHGRSR